MEKKHSISRNLLVIAMVIVLIGVVAAVAASQNRKINPTLGTLTADGPAVTAEPEVAEAATLTGETETADAIVAADGVETVVTVTAAPDAVGDAADGEAGVSSTEAAATSREGTADVETEVHTEPPEAYLVVTVAGMMYEPIPLYAPGRYTVSRGDLVNVIEVTADSVWMAESSCDNQDCVEQGVVSLENKTHRVLQNMIICLPNEVVLELYTTDELVQLLLSMAAYAEDAGNE